MLSFYMVPHVLFGAICRLRPLVVVLSTTQEWAGCIQWFGAHLTCTHFGKYIFTELAPRPIQSISRYVHLSVCLLVCLFVPSVGGWN